MRPLVIAAAGVLLARSAPGVLQHGPQAPHPPRVELPGEGISVPMGSFGGRPTVEARVGAGSFTFVFDTGASGCAVADAFADSQHIPVLGRAGVASPDSPSEPKEARLLRIDELGLGGARILELTAVAMDLSGPFPAEGDPVGVLSAGMFPGLLVTLDYPARSVALARGELPAADGLEVFDYEAGRRVPGLPVTLGDQTVEVDVDSGSPGGLTLPAEWASRLKLEGPLAEAKPDRRIDRVLSAKEARLAGSARIGRFELGGQSIRFVDGIKRGLVGSDVLKRFVVTLDSKNRRVRLREPGR